MNENKKEMIEVTEISETKKEEVISKVKNWFDKNGKKLKVVAATAGVAIVGIAGFVLGKASTYTEYEEIDTDVIDENDDSEEDSNIEE